MIVTHFYKYQGTGNDFILIDDRQGKYEKQLSKEHIAWLCHRRFGIGADGLMLLQTSENTDFKMVYYNSDGRTSSMCGNGGRCIVSFANHLGIINTSCTFEAIDGIHEASISNGIVTLKMNSPHGYKKLDTGNSWIHTGSPHYVEFLNESLDAFPVYEKGKTVRHSKTFAEDGGTNANFVNVLGDHKLMVRTFERGVEDETLSCGTGVTACAYVYLLEQKSSQSSSVSIKTLGGDLSVGIENMGRENEKIYLKGPATFVFEGDVAVKTLG